MRKYSYTLIVDDINESEDFYEKYFGWTAEKKSESFVMINTESPLSFSIVEKEYLFHILNIGESEIPVRSFCTWLYDSKDELLSEKDKLLSKGMIQIGTRGHFLKDVGGTIWELRKKGDMI